MAGFHSGPVLARTAPRDLTVQDCKDGWFDVTVWCPSCRVGRPLKLAILDRWASRRLLDIMRAGVTCTKCGDFVDAVSVSSTEMADQALFWRLGDDAMPRA